LASFLTVSAQRVINPKPNACEAFENLERDEVWRFNSSWVGQSLVETAQFTCVKPFPVMTFVLSLSFCNNVNLSYTSQQQQGLGWFYGVLVHFQYIRPVVDPGRPVLTFQQAYSLGDEGAPCGPAGRSLHVDIWCGNASTTCLQIPGGDQCLRGTPDSVCLCSITCNDTQGICTGITMTLLSHNCPKSQIVIIPKPDLLPDHNVAGVVIGSLIAIFFFFLFIGFMYNYLVHHKTGCTAIPFYDTCTGETPAVRPYESIPHKL